MTPYEWRQYGHRIGWMCFAMLAMAASLVVQSWSWATPPYKYSAITVVIVTVLWGMFTLMVTLRRWNVLLVLVVYPGLWTILWLSASYVGLIPPPRQGAGIAVLIIGGVSLALSLSRKLGDE